MHSALFVKIFRPKLAECSSPDVVVAARNRDAWNLSEWDEDLKGPFKLINRPLSH